MIVVRTLAVLAFTLVTGLSYAQECALGPAPTCGGTCQDGFVCTIGQSGTPCECVAGAALDVTKLSIKLNFAKPLADSIQLKALLPIQAGFVVAGRMVGVDVGGVSRLFVLDEKGKGVSDGAQVKLSVKASKGMVAAQTAKFAVKFSKGSFAASLADEGLTNATIDEALLEVRTIVTIDGELNTKQQPLRYKATQGKTGKASKAK